MKTLILVSGGIDSVGALWDILTNTDDEVLVQHIKVDCYEKYWEAEKQAFDSIIEYISEICRPFTILPMNTYKTVGSATLHDITAVFSALTGIRYNCDRVVRARLVTDLPPGGSTHRILRGEKLFEVAKGNNKIIYDHPYAHLKKTHWHKIGVPKKIFQLSISCTRPINNHGTWENCRTCVQCHQLNYAERGKELLFNDKKELYDTLNVVRDRYVWPLEYMKYAHDPVNNKFGKPAIMFMYEGTKNDEIQLSKLLENTEDNIMVKKVNINKSIDDDKLNQLRSIREFELVHEMELSNEEGWLDWQAKILKPFACGITALCYKNLIKEIISTDEINENNKQIYDIASSYCRQCDINWKGTTE